MFISSEDTAPKMASKLSGYEIMRNEWKHGSMYWDAVQQGLSGVYADKNNAGLQKST